MTSEQHPAHNSNEEPQTRRRKPEWARQVLSLYGSNELTREIASARTTNLGNTIAIEAHSYLTHESVREMIERHPGWCKEDSPAHRPCGTRGFAHVGAGRHVHATTGPRDDRGECAELVLRPVMESRTSEPTVQFSVHSDCPSMAFYLTGQECVELIGHLLEMVEICEADLDVAE